MRVWDLPPKLLCNQHLLGEHNEIHVMYSTLRAGKGGWLHHVETKRWRGRIDALVARHDALVVEMQTRGWTGHKTPLDKVGDFPRQIRLWQRRETQIAILESRGCKCKTKEMRDALTQRSGKCLPVT